MKDKYKMLILYLVITTPVLVIAWILTSNHLYNLIPLFFMIIGILQILALDD